MTGDRERRTIWMTRGTELVRLDMDTAKPEPQMVATIPAGEWLIAPDLSGGVWLASRNDVRRIDGGGRTLFTIPLRSRR